MATPILEVKDLSIQFGGLKAVDRFNLTLNRGELSGLIGPNGAGKTTIFNLLTGVYAPTNGTITLEGQRIEGKKVFELSRLGLARTFQNIRLFKNLSVLDNLMLGMYQQTKYGLFSTIFQSPLFFKEESEMQSEAIRLLKIFDLDSKKDHQACGLPYGEQRKLEILRALATKPKILLLDEPAAGMNPSETEGLMNVISKIRSEFHLTLLLIEHDMKFVMSICENIHVVDHGIKIAEGEPKSIQNHPEVIRAYLGSDEEA